MAEIVNLVKVIKGEKEVYVPETELKKKGKENKEKQQYDSRGKSANNQQVGDLIDIKA